MARTLPRSVPCLAVWIAGCVASGPSIDRAGIDVLLATQGAGWNRGDMDAFMATYWDSPALTFVGSSGLTRGHADTLARYRRSYPDAASRGVLTFELEEFRPLGDGTTALVVGRWHLERDAPAHGTFSLVVAQRPDGLRIVHDHSSPDG